MLFISLVLTITVPEALPPTTTAVKDKHSSFSFRWASHCYRGTSVRIIWANSGSIPTPLPHPPSSFPLPTPSHLFCLPLHGGVEARERIKLASFHTFSWQTVSSRSERCHAPRVYFISTSETENKSGCFLMDAVKHHAITTVCHEKTYNVFGNFQTTDHTLSSSLCQWDWQRKQWVDKRIEN